jgi:transposase
MSAESMHYVGLDVHLRRSSLHVLDEHGNRVKALEVRGGWPALVAEVERSAPRPFAVCYEASCGYGYLYEQLAPLAARVAVAHPGHLRLIYRSKRKNDRVDAAKLAKLLYLDLVPRVHVPAADVRAWRALITYRHKLIDERVRVKNQLRALLRGLGVADVPAGKRLWAGKGLAWLRELPLADAADALRRDLAVDELDEVNARLRRVDKELDRRAADHPGVTLLRTIPGVGVRTAEAVVAWVDDVARFARTKHVGSYFGLVPCQDASAGKDRLGHVTRDGPPAVRKLLCEAAWQGVRRSPALRAFLERVMRGDPDRKKVALVATAHHLARAMAAMLRTGEAWRETTTETTATTTATTQATTAATATATG